MNRILVGGLVLALLAPAALGQAPGGAPGGFDPQALRRMAPVIQAMTELLNLVSDLREVDLTPATRLNREQAAAVSRLLRDASARPALDVSSMEGLQIALEDVLTPAQIVALDRIALQREQEARRRVQSPGGQPPFQGGQGGQGAIGAVRIADDQRELFELLLAGEPVNPLTVGRGEQLVRGLLERLAGR